MSNKKTPSKKVLNIQCGNGKTRAVTVISETTIFGFPCFFHRPPNELKPTILSEFSTGRSISAGKSKQQALDNFYAKGITKDYFIKARNTCIASTGVINE